MCALKGGANGVGDCNLKIKQEDILQKLRDVGRTGPAVSKLGKKPAAYGTI